MRLGDKLEDDELRGYPGCFIYNGEVYTSLSYSDAKAIEALEGLYAKHPDQLVKAAALRGIIFCMMREIKRKYCS